MRLALLLLAVAATALANDAVFPEDAVLLSRDSRIVSGWLAEEGQIPFQLSLRMVNSVGNVNACGGSIISTEWALTAAHCTATRTSFMIRAGATNLTRPAYIFEATEWHNHPLYNNNLQSVVQQHDIGLIKFGRPVTFNALVQPVRLQRSADKNRDYQNKQAVASGYGLTWTGGSSTEHLNWVHLRLVPTQECQAAYWGQAFMGPSTICTRGYDNPTQSTCQGDSGGPLTTIDDDGAITQVGVTSFVSGWGCHAGIPSGFVRPGHYHEWLTEVTGINFDWDFNPEAPETTTTTEAPETTTTTEAPETTVATETTEAPETTTTTASPEDDDDEDDDNDVDDDNEDDDNDVDDDNEDDDNDVDDDNEDDDNDVDDDNEDDDNDDENEDDDDDDSEGDDSESDDSESDESESDESESDDSDSEDEDDN